MNYHLEDLDPSSFEELVIAICHEILGMGVVSFAEGKDGGTDGKFEGTANKYPSESEKWSGKFIIQAKRTSNPIASCSDSDFIKTIENEIEKIKKLKANNKIDNYLLFTNRKYTGIKGEELLQKIKTKTKVINVAIIGKETIHSYLDSNKNIVNQFNLGIPASFNFDDEEIKEVLVAFKKYLSDSKKDIEEAIEKIKNDYSYIEKEEKNKKNKLGKVYYKESILENSSLYFNEIRIFLTNPINEKFKEYYEGTAHELNEKILINRDNYNAFEELFGYISQEIWHGEPSTKINKRHVTMILHYMYFECLIGKK